MSFSSLVRRLQSKFREQPRRRFGTQRRSIPGLESLETRTMPSAVIPEIKSVTTTSVGPHPGNVQIVISFNEDVLGAGKATAADPNAATADTSNFVLYASDGSPITITQLTYTADFATNTYTTTILNSNIDLPNAAGVPNHQLVSDTYSLFVEGDKISDAATGTAFLTSPGQVVVANQGPGGSNLSTLSFTDGLTSNTTGANAVGGMSNLDVPPNSSTDTLNDFGPMAVDDLNGDGIPDLILANRGTNQVQIFLGLPGGGYNSTPAETLSLPAGALPVQILTKDLLTGNAGDPGLDDIAVLDAGINRVSIFIDNPPTAGVLGFSTSQSASYPAGASPLEMTIGRFNTDAYYDIAVADSAVDGNKFYDVSVLLGQANGKFDGNLDTNTYTNVIRVGKITANNTQVGIIPSTITAGQFFSSGFEQDIAVAGGSSTNVDLIDMLKNTGGTATTVSFDFNTPGIAGIFLPLTGNVIDLVASNVQGPALHGLQDVMIVEKNITQATNGGDGVQMLLQQPENGSGSLSGTFALSEAVDPLPPNPITGQSTFDPTQLGQVTLADMNHSGSPQLVFDNVESQTTGASIVVDQSFAAGIGSASGSTISTASDPLTPGQLTPGEVLLVTESEFPSGVGDFSNCVVASVAPDGTSFTVTGASFSGAVQWITVPDAIGTIGPDPNPADVNAGGTTPIAITTNTADLPEGLAQQLGTAIDPYDTRTGAQVTISNIPSTSPYAFLNNNTYFVSVQIYKGVPYFDLIGANTSPKNPIVTTGNGGGNWLVSQPVLPFAGPVAVADVNQDGNPDVIVYSNQNDSVSVYKGAGDGLLLGGTNISVPQPQGGFPSTPSTVAVGDLNGDGIPDMVTADAANNLIDVYFGQPGGGYSPPVAYSTMDSQQHGQDPVSVTIADINNDGIPDIIVADHADNRISILLGVKALDANGNRVFSPAYTVIVGDNPTQIAVGDFNNDGALDLAVAHDGATQAGRGVTILIGKGDGTFLAPTEIDVGVHATSIAAANFTGKTDRFGNPILSLVVTDDTSNGQVVLNLGDGQGNFAAGEDFTVGPDPIQLAVADFNGDGFPDVVTISGSTTTTKNISVLLNNLGYGFGAPIYTQVGIGTGNEIRSVSVVHVNQDAFADLLVTYDSGGNASTARYLNNIQLLTGLGGGEFSNTLPPFQSNAIDVTTATPSLVSVVDDPFHIITTFTVVSNYVGPNLTQNGSFEHPNLAGQSGNLDGWNTYNLPDPNGGSAGQWSIQTGTASPLSSVSVPGPTAGIYQAMLDENDLFPQLGSGLSIPNPSYTYDGTHVLYQEVTIPANAEFVSLYMDVYLNSAAPWDDASTNPALNYTTADANQQVRIDIMKPPTNSTDPSQLLSTDLVSDGGYVLDNIYQTDPSQHSILNPNQIQVTGTNHNLHQGVSLEQFAGQTVLLRIATTNNQGKLIVGVDNVKLVVDYVDTTAPGVKTPLSLDNSSFLSGPNTLPQSTDQTIYGQVADNGSSNNIREIVFDLHNDGFNQQDNAVITNLDSTGNFALTLPSAQHLLPGVYHVPVEIVDKGYNVFTTEFDFIIQGPSLATWEAQGPEQIDISAQTAGTGIDYSTVSGQITSIAYDPSDPTGNSYYVGSDNGGIWYTNDGGKDFRALTDDIINPEGVRIPVPIAAIAAGSNGVVYAATGTAFNLSTTRGSVGILYSNDNGLDWAVLGGNVFAGAHISAMVVDPTNNSIAYVAVAWWDNPALQPGVYRTVDGGQTWTNILNPANMIGPGGTALGSGTLLASVTDLIIDNHTPARVIIGMGNIGDVAASATAGVWVSTNANSTDPNSPVTWTLVQGGDNPNVAKNTIPTGLGVGRVTVAMGTGRVGDQRFIYVLMATPPSGSGVSAPFQQGNELGLFKSSDNMSNFTQVMLDQQTNPLATRSTPTFTPIDLLGDPNTGLGEGSNFGALAVDPTDPNVVYVGGSDQPQMTSETPALSFLQHGVVRIDTGDMRDATYIDPLSGKIPNDGDDIQKAYQAEVNFILANGGIVGPGADSSGAGIYPGGQVYTGEGVYWYDLQEASSNSSRIVQLSTNPAVNDNVRFQQMPGSINTIGIDPSGRVLFGTVVGLYQIAPQGFGYDFTSGSPFGILATEQPNYKINPPAVTELNSNLQISDLTSVAIDPTTFGSYYTSQSQTGTANSSAGPSGWTALNGLTGPTINTTPAATTYLTPSAYQILTSAPPANAAPGSGTTVYRVWQNNPNTLNFYSSLIPEVSFDGGQSFQPIDPKGISVNDSADVAPILALNPNKIPVNNSSYDQLLFGTNRVYVANTQTNIWDPVNNGGPINATPAGAVTPYYIFPANVTALAFAPSVDVGAGGGKNVYYAGLDNGQVWYDNNNSGWVSRSTGLPAAPISSLTVDPGNASIAYATIASLNGAAGVHIYQTTNAGVSWHPFVGSGANGLPSVPVYSMVIVTTPTTTASKGYIYVGTEIGVFATVNGGAGTSWGSVGKGLPNAPVVNLQYNASQGTLAAALQGRGVFTLSTNHNGPYVTTTPVNTTVPLNVPSLTPTSPVPSPVTTATVSFNEAVYPTSFTTAGDAAARQQIVLGLLKSTTFGGSLVTQLFGTFPSTSTAGVTIKNASSIAAQPNGSVTLAADLIGSAAYITNAKANGFVDANANWLFQAYKDLFDTTLQVSTDPLTGTDTFIDTGAQTFLYDLDNNLTTTAKVATALVGMPAYQANVVALFYNKYAATNYPTPAPVADTVISGWLSKFSQGTSFQTFLSTVLSSDTAYQDLSNLYSLPNSSTALAVATGDFTGNVDSNGNPILDLAVAERTNSGSYVVAIYQGDGHGGYSSVASDTLLLPSGAVPTTMLVADLNNDNRPDLIVANTGLGSSAANSISVFINNGMGGQISFARARTLNGGNNPVGLAVSNVNFNPGGNLDIVVADSTADASGKFDVSILLGNGDGTFNSTPVVQSVGSTTTTGMENPTGVAVGDLNNDGYPDIVVSGLNGLTVLTNTTSTTGGPGATPTFTEALLSNLTTTSVAVGAIDTTGANDIVATTNQNGGEVLVYQNHGTGTGNGNFTGPTVLTFATNGAAPEDVQLVQLTVNPLLDIVVTNATAAGMVSVFINTTVHNAIGSDTITFANAVPYSVPVSYPTSLALGAPTTSGIPNVAIASDVGSQVAFGPLGTLSTISNQLTPTAVALGNFTGNTDSFGKPILDLAVAEESGIGGDVVAIYQGLATGGYQTTPSMFLTLPAGAVPTSLLVNDVHGNGLDENLIVGYSGATDPSGATISSIALFQNSGTATGQINLTSTPTVTYNGGADPVALTLGDVDGDGKLDLIVANGQVDINGNYDVTILMGNGDGTFTSPTNPPVSVSVTGVGAPTDVAVGNLSGNIVTSTGNPGLDLVVTGNAGIEVLDNVTTQPGAANVTFAQQAPLNTVPMSFTSVAIGPIDSGSTNDIVATTKEGGGELLVYLNGGFQATTPGAFLAVNAYQIGSSPAAVHLVDLTGNGQLDIVVADSATVDNTTLGAVTVVSNLSVAEDSSGNFDLSGEAVNYSSLVSNPTELALGDVNQDGVPDIVVASPFSPSFALVLGDHAGSVQSPTDTRWLENNYQTLMGQPISTTTFNSELTTLHADEEVYLVGPEGSVAPLSIRPANSSDTSYTLTFPAQVYDGTYTLVFGTDSLNLDVKDFIDQNGSFLNIGNAMNQNRNAVNGQNPADRFSAPFAINTSDDGTFVAGLYQDLLGNSSSGRPANTAGFLTQLQTIEPARLQALKTVVTDALLGTNSVASPDAYRIAILDDLFAFEGLGSDPNAAADAGLIDSGKATEETILTTYLGTTFDSTITDNGIWLTAVYTDLFGHAPAASDPIYTANLNLLNGSTSRLSVATKLVANSSVQGRMVDHLYEEYLLRMPVSSAGLNEVAPNVTLLQQNKGGKGKITSYEQVIENLLGSPEYLALHGNSNEGWVSAFNNVLAGAGSAIKGASTSMVLGLYQAKRQAVVTAITGSQEFRNRVYLSYFSTFLGTSPSTADLTSLQQTYQGGGNRLEAVAATILSGQPYQGSQQNGVQFYPLSGQGSGNSGWLQAVYGLLLHRAPATVTTDPNYALDQQRLSYLASHSQSASTLEAARKFIALQILNSTEYRGDLIAGFFNTYLIGKIPASSLNQMNPFKLPFDSNPVTDVNASLVSTFVKQMNAGMTQQAVLANLLTMSFTAINTNGNKFTLSYFELPHA